MKRTTMKSTLLWSGFLTVGLALAVRAEEAEMPANALAGRRIAALVADGFHPGETRQPITFWEKHGAEVLVVGIEPGTVKAAFGPQELEIVQAVGDVSLEAIDAIFIPGGTSPAVLRKHPAVLDFVRRANAAGKVVAAICHGPQVLISAGVLDGRRATCVTVEEREYFAVRDELVAAGGVYVNEEVVIDGTIVTSRLPDDVPAFQSAVANILRGIEKP